MYFAGHAAAKTTFGGYNTNSIIGTEGVAASAMAAVCLWWTCTIDFQIVRMV